MAKKPKTGFLSFLSNRNNLLIIFIIVVIIAAVYLIVSSGEEETIYSIEEINDNPEEFIGETVTVTGYYDSSFGKIHDEGGSQFQQSDYDPDKEMSVDLTAVNVTKLDGDNEFLFTGTVTGEPGNLVLEVTKLRRHR